jgi:hypothetical protein
LGRLTKLCQVESVSNFIMVFKQLDIKMEGIYDEFYIKCFLGINKSRGYEESSLGDYFNRSLLYLSFPPRRGK